jgi:hypothetical protein
VLANRTHDLETRNIAMNRRKLLTTAAVVVTLPLLMAGTCAVTLAQGAQYVVAAGNATSDCLSNLPTSAVTTEIKSLTTTIVGAATAVAAAPVAAGASLGQQAYNAIKSLLPLAAPFVAAIPGAGLGIMALQALLPFIAQFAGLVGAETAGALDSRIPQMSIAQVMKAYGQK